MSKQTDFAPLIGKRFGRLTLIGKAACSSKQGNSQCVCLCDCGTKHVVLWVNLKQGKVNSCGCLKREPLREKLFRHGLTKTRIHRIWQNMLTRCENPKGTRYKHYGGRGIEVCAEWHSFQNFFNDMGQPPTEKHQLERTNNDFGYSKGNCIWATPIQQANNTRKNHFITIDGERRSIAQWARKFNLSPSTISYRISVGWNPELAACCPPTRSIPL